MGQLCCKVHVVPKPDARLQAMIDKLNEACRIAKEEAEQARKERDEAQGSIEATYAEGRALIAKAREEKEELVQQREAERGIVKKAMDELKSLQIQVGLTLLDFTSSCVVVHL